MVFIKGDEYHPPSSLLRHHTHTLELLVVSALLVPYCTVGKMQVCQNGLYKKTILKRNNELLIVTTVSVC